MLSKKRVAPAPVAPVVHRGVRYEALHWGMARDLGQNGGHLLALDAATGEERWILKVYEVDYDPALEGDVQDCLITRLKLLRWPDRLIVTNEAGDRYAVELDSLAVTPM